MEEKINTCGSLFTFILFRFSHASVNRTTLLVIDFGRLIRELFACHIRALVGHCTFIDHGGPHGLTGSERSLFDPHRSGKLHYAVLTVLEQNQRKDLNKDFFFFFLSKPCLLKLWYCLSTLQPWGSHILQSTNCRPFKSNSKNKILC